MDTTPKWAIPYLEGTDIGDTIDDVDAASAALLDDLLTPYAEGTLASRPVSTPGSPGIKGRWYRATDTGVLFYDYGTGWQVVLAGPTPEISATGEANLRFFETSAGADLKRTRFRIAGGITRYELVNDAFDTIVRQFFAINHADGILILPQGAKVVANLEVTGNLFTRQDLYLGPLADAYLRRTAAGILDTQNLRLTGSLMRPVTATIPGSPIEVGQEILLHTGAMNANGIGPWPLRYGGSGVWHPLGAVPMFHGIDAQQSTTSTSLTDLATVGPTLTVPASGVYDLSFDCQAFMTGTGAWAVVELARNGTGLGIPGAGSFNGGVVYGNIAFSTRMTLTAGDVIKATYMYDNGTSGAALFRRRRLRLAPVSLTT